jgi:hypothetical protein
MTIPSQKKNPTAASSPKKSHSDKLPLVVGAEAWCLALSCQTVALCYPHPLAGTYGPCCRSEAMPRKTMLASEPQDEREHFIQLPRET